MILPARYANPLTILCPPPPHYRMSPSELKMGDIAQDRSEHPKPQDMVIIRAVSSRKDVLLYDWCAFYVEGYGMQFLPFLLEFSNSELLGMIPLKKQGMQTSTFSLNMTNALLKVHVPYKETAHMNQQEIRHWLDTFISRTRK